MPIQLFLGAVAGDVVSMDNLSSCAWQANDT